MIFQDNVLKEYLKNVYFISGTPCGGKTTISKYLARNYGLPVYDADQRFSQHQEVSDPAFQPAMNKKFANADEFFGRSVEEYSRWLTESSREQLDFVIMDLIRLSRDRKIICDCNLTVKQAERITDVSRIAFLIKSPGNLVDDYCSRRDHRDFTGYINSCTDARKAKAVCNRTLRKINEPRYLDIKNSRYFWVDRAENLTAEQTAGKVRRHFGW